ncbi:hypothetical protein HMN09_00927200 [Mycena chlorophos]|uniref:F-box domain-containing protein n=1 Tax=Mycena chlorophos TaxID=658473 RepID=A0A8H6SKE8_MYCCL|nr:hypothetical protein HMN09_00927200 [Mycena chlorophos]
MSTTRPTSSPASPSPQPRLPQELLDLILDFVTDTPTLKSCALAAHSLLYTAQKHLFTRLTIFPAARTVGWRPWRTPLNPTKLAELFAASPALATHVRELTLLSDSGSGNPAWLNEGPVPVSRTLYVFTGLTTLVIESRVTRLSWLQFPGPLKAALCALVALPSMTSVTLRNIRFTSTTHLVGLLSGGKALRHLTLGLIMAATSPQAGEMQEVPPQELLALESIALDAFSGTLFTALANQIDPRALRHLDIKVRGPPYEALAQNLVLAHAENLHTLRVALGHEHTAQSAIDLRTLPRLHTLELAVELAYMYKPDDYAPLLWVSHILGRPGRFDRESPSRLRTLVLDLFVDDADLRGRLFRDLGSLVPSLTLWAARLSESHGGEQGLFVVRLDAELDFSISAPRLEADVRDCFRGCFRDASVAPGEGVRVEVVLLGLA